jgi:hypothetical protein
VVVLGAGVVFAHAGVAYPVVAAFRAAQAMRQPPNQERSRVWGRLR